MKQMFNPEYDWVFRTTPQKHAKNGVTTPDGLQHESFFWTRYAIFLQFGVQN